MCWKTKNFWGKIDIKLFGEGEGLPHKLLIYNLCWNIKRLQLKSYMKLSETCSFIFLKRDFCVFWNNTDGKYIFAFSEEEKDKPNPGEVFFRCALFKLKMFSKLWAALLF